VEVDTEAPNGVSRHRAQHLVNPRRAFYRLTFRVDGVPDPTALYERFEGFCRRQAAEQGVEKQLDSSKGPVVDVALTGVLAFDNSAIDRTHLEACVERHFAPLVVRIHDVTRGTDYALDDEMEGDGRDRTTWHQLELRVFQDLLRRDARFAPDAERWATTLAELKQMALSDDVPEHITQRLREARQHLGER
jgi:hypothetical protein